MLQTNWLVPTDQSWMQEPFSTRTCLPPGTSLASILGACSAVLDGESHRRTSSTRLGFILVEVESQSNFCRNPPSTIVRSSDVDNVSTKM